MHVVYIRNLPEENIYKHVCIQWYYSKKIRVLSNTENENSRYPRNVVVMPSRKHVY